MANGEIVPFPTPEGEPIPVMNVLGAESVQNAEQLLILGWGKDGNLLVSATHQDLASNAWLCTIATKIFVDNTTG